MPRIQSPSEYNRTTMDRLEPGLKGRAYHLLEDWASTNQLRPYKGRPCLQKLVDPRHKCSSQKCYGHCRSVTRFRVMAHVEEWRAPDGSLVLTAHPYGLYQSQQLADWCQRKGLRCEIKEPSCSWYIPECTHLVVVWGNARRIN